MQLTSLLKPPLDVGEKVAKHLVLEVVEDLGVPVRMMSLQAAMRVAVIGAIHPQRMEKPGLERQRDAQDLPSVEGAKIL